MRPLSGYCCLEGRSRKVVPVTLEQGLMDLAIVTLLAALTPILAGLLARLRVPQVVILIIGGIVIGPQVLGWAEPEAIELIDPRAKRQLTATASA